MILNVRQRDYVPESGDTAAIRLVIHPQDRMPFPEDEGFNISPGFSTSIGIKQVDDYTRVAWVVYVTLNSQLAYDRG